MHDNSKPSTPPKDFPSFAPRASHDRGGVTERLRKAAAKQENRRRIEPKDIR
jgi:hypothetical protein